MIEAFKKIWKFSGNYTYGVLFHQFFSWKILCRYMNFILRIIEFLNCFIYELTFFVF